MLTKNMQRRLNPETRENIKQAFRKCFMSGRIENFFQEEGIKFCHFFKRSFFDRVNFKQLE